MPNQDYAGNKQRQKKYTQTIQVHRQTRPRTAAASPIAHNQQYSTTQHREYSFWNDTKIGTPDNVSKHLCHLPMLH